MNDKRKVGMGFTLAAIFILLMSNWYSIYGVVYNKDTIKISNHLFSSIPSSEWIQSSPIMIKKGYHSNMFKIYCIQMNRNNYKNVRVLSYEVYAYSNISGKIYDPENVDQQDVRIDEFKVA